jgi:hypothetical protein
MLLFIKIVQSCRTVSPPTLFWTCLPVTSWSKKEHRTDATHKTWTRKLINKLSMVNLYTTTSHETISSKREIQHPLPADQQLGRQTLNCGDTSSHLKTLGDPGLETDPVKLWDDLRHLQSFGSLPFKQNEYEFWQNKERILILLENHNNKKGIISLNNKQLSKKCSASTKNIEVCCKCFQTMNTLQQPRDNDYQPSLLRKPQLSQTTECYLSRLL